MESIGPVLGILAAALLLGSLVWLHVRGFKDGAFSDPVFFLTGISLVAYTVTRPDRTRVPAAIAIIAALVLAITAVSNVPSQEHGAIRAFNQGVAALNREDFEQAIACFSEAIRLDPTFAKAYHNRGLAHDFTGEHDKAIADYTEAIRLNPKDPDTHHVLGLQSRVDLPDKRRTTQSPSRLCEGQRTWVRAVTAGPAMKSCLGRFPCNSRRSAIPSRDCPKSEKDVYCRQETTDRHARRI